MVPCSKQGQPQVSDTQVQLPVGSYGPRRYCMVFSCSVDLLGGSTSRCGKCFLGLDIKIHEFIYFFSYSQCCSCCRHSFFFCLQRFRKFNSYYELLSNVSFLQRIERGSFFFFSCWHLKSRKKNLTTTTEFY